MASTSCVPTLDCREAIKDVLEGKRRFVVMYVQSKIFSIFPNSTDDEKAIKDLHPNNYSAVHYFRCPSFILELNSKGDNIQNLNHFDFGTLKNITKEILIYIFSYLQIDSISSIIQTCKYFKKMSNCDMFWKDIVQHKNIQYKTTSNYLKEKFYSEDEEDVGLGLLDEPVLSYKELYLKNNPKSEELRGYTRNIFYDLCRLLPENESRLVLFRNRDRDRDEDREEIKHRFIFLFWCPHLASTKSKMAHQSASYTLDRYITSISFKIHAWSYHQLKFLL